MGFLRIFLSIAVIFNHMQLQRSYMIDGGNAVKIFFMISGFYMAMILSEKYGNTRHGLKKFAENRFLRLYPTYFAVLVLTLGWYLVCVWVTHGRTPPPTIVKLSSGVSFWQAGLFWMANITLVGIDLPSLFHWSAQSGFLFLRQLPFVEQNEKGVMWLGYTVWVRQAWSIGAELWFYALAPVIVFGSLRRILLIGASSGLVGILLVSLYGRPVTFFWPALLVFFVAGILLYKGYKAFDLAARLPKSAALKYLIILSPVIWMVVIPYFGIPFSDVVLYGVAALSIPVLFEITKKNRFDRFIGNLSYGTYLDHLLVAGITVLAAKNHALPEFAVLPLVIAGSIFLACGLERFIERPIDNFRARNAKS